MKKLKIYNENTFIYNKRIFINLTKNDLKEILKSPKDNTSFVRYLIDVIHFYKNELLEIITNSKTNDLEFLSYFLKGNSEKLAIALIFERTTKETLKKFFEISFLPYDDLFCITANLKNELKEEESFLSKEEYDIILKKEVCEVLENYSLIL